MLFLADFEIASGYMAIQGKNTAAAVRGKSFTVLLRYYSVTDVQLCSLAVVLERVKIPPYALPGSAVQQQQQW